MAQQQAIHKFVLGSKELDGKTAEFLYDKGWYSITDIIGEERNLVYKSRNAQEAYMKWNVYIGRKKERSIPINNRSENSRTENNRSENSRRNENRSERTHTDTGAQSQDNHDNRDRKDGSRRHESGGRKRSRNNRDYRRQQNDANDLM